MARKTPKLDKSKRKDDAKTEAEKGVPVWPDYRRIHDPRDPNHQEFATRRNAPLPADQWVLTAPTEEELENQIEELEEKFAAGEVV